MIDQSLQDGSLTLGPRTREFEEAFALRHEVAHAIAVSSGTSALEIIFRTLEVKDREVVIPTNTFFATAAAAVHAGGIPRLADVSPDTLALSPETLEAALTPQTAVVVLVHIGGFITPEIDAIRGHLRPAGDRPGRGRRPRPWRQLRGPCRRVVRPCGGLLLLPHQGHDQR